MSACSRVVLTQMLNVFLTMVGAGIVSLPLAMRASSLYIGCVSLFLAGLACCLSMHLCAWLARRPLCQTPSNKNAPLLNTGFESTYDVDLLQRADAPSKVLQSYDEIITTYLPPWGSTLGNSTIVILLLFVLAPPPPPPPPPSPSLSQPKMNPTVLLCSRCYSLLVLFLNTPNDHQLSFLNQMFVRKLICLYKKKMKEKSS